MRCINCETIPDIKVKMCNYCKKDIEKDRMRKKEDEILEYLMRRI